MHIAMIGLGRMGANMARRLMRAGHTCRVYDRDPGAMAQLAAEGAVAVDLPGLARLAPPRVAWLMVPAGEATEDAITEVASHFTPGDIIVDGGNSHFKDSVRRSRQLRALGIHLVDAGTSGGIWGLERGYCLMIGGEAGAVKQVEPIFRALAPPGGWLHCGPAGSGHFVKMVHNGIEYGLMQAYAEGFDILRGASSGALPEDCRYELAVGDIAELWRHGSVITSWLLDLAAAALAEDPGLSRFSGYVEDSGEGRWAVQAAVEEEVPAQVLTAALYARFRSRKEHTFGERLLSAMRQGFGGHREP